MRKQAGNCQICGTYTMISFDDPLETHLEGLCFGCAIERSPNTRNVKSFECPRCGGLCKREDKEQVFYGFGYRRMRYWTCMRCGDIRVIEEPKDWGTEEVKE